MVKAKDIIEEVKKLAETRTSNIYVSYSGRVHSGYYTGRGYRDGIVIKYDSETVTDWDAKEAFVRRTITGGL